MAGLDISRRQALALSLGGAALAALPSWAHAAATTDESAIDAIITSYLSAYDIPGLAIAIVRPGVEPFLKGYGVRTLGRPEPVDVHTRFGIASNSKSFTAAALAMMVDAGKIGWDDPVIKHLPEFKMYDPVVTQLMTVRDLLTHRSGLPLGAGDLMIFPATDRPASEVLAGLQYLAPVRGFRAGYDYDNILYICAGLLIERLAGMSWAAFVQSRLLAPLGMADATPNRRSLHSDNVAGRHARLGPPIRGLGPQRVIPPDEGPAVDAAGGINASVSDIAKWLSVQLAKGKLPSGEQLWSADRARDMWTPQTIINSTDGATPDSPTKAVFQGYALGWFVQDRRGERMIQHSGGLSGQVTQTAMLPARGIGVAVFTNVEDGVSGTIRNALLDHLIGAPPFDWLAYDKKRVAESTAETLASIKGGFDHAPPGGPSLPVAAYAGRYRDPWYGDIVVTALRKGLHIDFARTPQFKSMLDRWGPDSFRTRFPAEAGEDAVVSFAVKDGMVTGVTMTALSPLADFSYDFQHLHFSPVK